MDPESLIEHRAFLARLARGLLGDPHAAEDPVQDACLAALTLDRPEQSD